MKTGLKTAPPGLRFARNVVLKGLGLFIMINLVFALSDPLLRLGRLSAYNQLFPGRLRLPYGDQPDRDHNLSLFQLEAMFASHELAAGPKPDGEYRVLLIGDSATWGFLLSPGETLAASLNRSGISLPGHRQARFYNLGYPTMSLTKDLLILSFALRYQPDLIVWLITLESFPIEQQLDSPLLQHNPQTVRALIADYRLCLDAHDSRFVEEAWPGRTLIGQRRALADLLRLQLYGILWSATGVDQYIPDDFTPRMEDLQADQEFHGLQPPHLHPEDLALEVLSAGMKMTGEIPILLVNEPVFISHGKNSDIRYNFYYPRWAYDEYRQIMARISETKGWRYFDYWDAIPASEFTNTAIHVSPQGAAAFANRLAGVIEQQINATP